MVYILDRTGMVIANYVITLSPGMASDLGLDPTSPTVLPNGAWDVDHKKFSIVNPPAKRERTIAFIGRFEPEKGIDRMVTITDAISSETTVRFIGDGSGRELIERELHEPINTGQVIIDGWVDHDELPNLLNQCRLLVVPSRTEGLPTTILEAFACGVSAAATPVAGIPDIVHDEETGIHINSDTPERTAERIDQLLESEYIELGKSGRDLVESEYTFQQAVDRYEKIIETICT
ncbi:glycosyltransferase family 4 protein [Halopenitus malekzadehii]|nr:glycosyltransferase family 4 protein [Halopenitus malekzadehii]